MRCCQADGNQPLNTARLTPTPWLAKESSVGKGGPWGQGKSASTEAFATERHHLSLTAKATFWSESDPSPDRHLEY